MSLTQPTELFLTQGDNQQLRRWQIYSRDPITGQATPVDLTTATAVRMHTVGSAVTDMACTFLTDATGTVSRVFLTADLATTGDFPFETQVTWADGTIATFPSPGKDVMHVAAQIG